MKSLFFTFAIVSIILWTACLQPPDNSGSDQPSNPIIYNLGDIGPGGGLVFYDDSLGYDFDSSPSDWDGDVLDDPMAPWSLQSLDTSAPNAPAPFDIISDIGTGFANTAAIINDLGAGDYAAHICRDYLDSSWHLPSLGELILMNSFIDNDSYPIDLDEAAYWSSTEENASMKYVFNFVYDGVATVDYNTPDYSVRPIRAF